MIPIKTSVDLTGAKKLTEKVMRLVPIATAKALTFTAERAQANIVANMRGTFDAPTPYTLNSVYKRPATVKNLVAFVWLKDDAAKGTPASKYLFPEVHGGARRQKRGEMALVRMGLMDASQYFAPGKGMKLNQYGNVSAGIMTKILSGLGANPDSFQNVTSKSRQKAIEKGKDFPAFVGSPAGGRFPRGVWLRTEKTTSRKQSAYVNGRKVSTGTSKRTDRHVRPLLIFVRKPTYSSRLKFERICRVTYDRHFMEIFNRVFLAEIKKAGKR